MNNNSSRGNEHSNNKKKKNEGDTSDGNSQRENGRTGDSGRICVLYGIRYLPRTDICIP